MAEPIDYERLVASYEDRLLNQLRSHGVDFDFLEMWVPDEDTVPSMLNMVEAAGAFGAAGFSVRVGRESLPAARYPELERALAPLCHVTIESHGDHAIVHVRDIKG